MWYLLQNTEATALTAKHQTDFALRQLDCKQHGEHRTARYPVIVSFWETIYSSYNICSNSHFLPGVLSPVCANSIFNCEHIELANCSSAMLQLVNSTHRKPRAHSPSIGIIMQRTLPIVLVIIYKLCSLFSASVELYTYCHRLNVVNRSENSHWNKSLKGIDCGSFVYTYESAIDSTEL